MPLTVPDGLDGQRHPDDVQESAGVRGVRHIGSASEEGGPVGDSAEEAPVIVYANTVPVESQLPLDPPGVEVVAFRLEWSWWDRLWHRVIMWFTRGAGSPDKVGEQWPT